MSEKIYAHCAPRHKKTLINLLGLDESQFFENKEYMLSVIQNGDIVWFFNLSDVGETDFEICKTAYEIASVGATVNIQLRSGASQQKQLELFEQALEYFDLKLLPNDHPRKAKGRAPFGFLNSRGILVENREEIEALFLMFHMRDQNFTLVRIKEELENRRITNKGKPFSVSTIDSILKNRQRYEELGLWDTQER